MALSEVSLLLNRGCKVEWQGWREKGAASREEKRREGKMESSGWQGYREKKRNAEQEDPEIILPAVFL